MSRSTNELKIDFRDARASDLDALERFVTELYETDGLRNGTKPNVRLTLEHLGKYPMKGRLIAICHETQVIGYGIVVFFWSNEFASDVLEVDELCIAAGHRGLGAGAKFFQWLESEYPNYRCIALQVSHSNPARKLYERLGFREAPDIHMWKLRLPAALK